MRARISVRVTDSGYSRVCAIRLVPENDGDRKKLAKLLEAEETPTKNYTSVSLRETKRGGVDLLMEYKGT